jgi:Mg/Co/Ni transporter MgtE
VKVPPNRTWRDEVEADLASEFDEIALKEAEDDVLALARKVEKYSTPQWAEVFAELRETQQQAFKTMMSTDDEKLLLTARERARVITSIVDRLSDTERELAEATKRREILAGEREEE